jgi:hypothetical protein
MRMGTSIFRLALVAILTTISIALLWLCLTVFEPDVILFQAERIAGDRPYCVVVSDKDRAFQYNVAVNRSDLTYSALTTRLDWGGSAGSLAETYYSLLILKNPDEIRNWSKLYLNFESDAVPTQTSLVRNDLRKLCTPVADFGRYIR